MFFQVNDGEGNGADSFIEGKVPADPALLPPGTTVADFDTIQELVALIGVAPAVICRQVTAGDLITFQVKRAAATAQVVTRAVTGIQVSATGSGYDAAPVVLIAGDGTGATAVATVKNGVVTAITVTNPGSGYTTAPKVSVASAPFPSELAPRHRRFAG